MVLGAGPVEADGEHVEHMFDVEGHEGFFVAHGHVGGFDALAQFLGAVEVEVAPRAVFGAVAQLVVDGGEVLLCSDVDFELVGGLASFGGGAGGEDGVVE